MSETYADKAVRVNEELRRTTSEAHAAIKDLRGLLKEITEARAEWEGKVEQQIKMVFGEMLRLHVEAYGGQLKLVTEEGVKRVFARFDKIMAILMGEENIGDETMDDLARRVRAAIVNFEKRPELFLRDPR